MLKVFMGRPTRVSSPPTTHRLGRCGPAGWGYGCYRIFSDVPPGAGTIWFLPLLTVPPTAEMPK